MKKEKIGSVRTYVRTAAAPPDTYYKMFTVIITFRRVSLTETRFIFSSTNSTRVPVTIGGDLRNSMRTILY
jgi:hypothetical protein